MERRRILMEKEIEKLIQYAQGDSFKRLHLFLQFPDLRGAFQEIERKDLAAQRTSPSWTEQDNKVKCSRLVSFLSRIIEIKRLKNAEWIARAEICSKLGLRRS
jgi:hypothetical protein